MNDFEEIGDLTHLLYFNMMGLFSFREMTVQQAIDFWMEFLTNRLHLKIDTITIHPDKFDEWSLFYKNYDVVLQKNIDCTWSDGEISGYCTEFFVGDVEIGNIVNPLETCIDVGFGLERLEMFINGKKINRIETLKETALKIIESGYTPSNLKQGYVLRKILREIYKSKESLEHIFFEQEVERQKKIISRYAQLKDKNQDKSPEWWYDTHGINLEEIKEFNA